MEDLRCLVCQGQSIADSDAPLAGDMRHEVRTKIAAGESPDEIKSWLVARYGNWVSYDPPFDGATAISMRPFLVAGKPPPFTSVQLSPPSVDFQSAEPLPPEARK